MERPRDKSFPRIKIRGPCTLVRGESSLLKASYSSYTLVGIINEFTQEFACLENMAFPDDGALLGPNNYVHYSIEHRPGNWGQSGAPAVGLISITPA
jgi:hypothetical protein